MILPFHYRKAYPTVVYSPLLTLILLAFNCQANIPLSGNIPGDTAPHTAFLYPDDDPLGDFLSLTIPLKRAGRLFLIEARIDDQSGNFVFDTGATGLVLNKTYFRKYVSYEKPSSGGSIVGLSGKVYRIMVNRIEISGMHYENIEADLADLGHIENRRGVKILGLFGLNMIDDFEVIFDARNNQLMLNRTDKSGNRLDIKAFDGKFDFTRKMDIRKNILLIQGEIGNKVLSFCLDTGAETNVIGSHLPKKVLSTVQISRRSTLQGAGAGKVEVLYGTMNEFKFADHRFGKMETIVTNLEYMSDSYGFPIDGMLGYDFWYEGIFCFNFRKGEISFNLWR